MKKSIARVVCLLLSANLVSVPALAESPAEDLSYLTPDTLPPVRLVLENALGALPKSLGELQDWDRRMRLATLLPNLQVRFGYNEVTEDRFERLSQETTRDIRTWNSSDNSSIRISGDPLDSYVQTGDNDAYNRQRFYEYRSPVSMPLDDGTGWRENYFVQATWRLNELIYHNDEIEAAQVNRFIAAYRIEFMNKMVNMYKTFREYVSDYVRDPKSVYAYENLAGQLAILDELTDNYISEFSKFKYAELNGGAGDTSDYVQPVKKKFSPESASEPVAQPVTADALPPAVQEEVAQGLIPVVTTVPGTLADIRRQDMEAEEEAQAEAEQASLEDLAPLASDMQQSANQSDVLMEDRPPEEGSVDLMDPG
ncbi:MAG: hypothetical protein KDL31_13670, partial [Kiritimatiellae bacterium]|nr:hypothetical protein [Kiritimatiellia bacterium]